MPHLRFSRDKRGYENTFVVHAGRHRGKGRTRILYWFRTPPGVRVGRAALDQDAIRLIEEHNPDVEFDWTRILKGGEEPAPEPRSDPRRVPKGQPRREKTSVAPVRPPLEVASASDPEVAAEAETVALPVPAEPMTAALARLGPEGLLRLRARFAEVMARIAEKAPDPVKLEELKTQAERLNPDTWVTDVEVSAGLEQYETVVEALRSVIGHRRRRKRSKPGGTQGPGSDPVSP